MAAAPLPPVPPFPAPPSALPSVRARVLAFLAILIAGACGALISYGIVDVQCGGDSNGRAGAATTSSDDGGDCDGAKAVGAVAGGVVGAGGVAVVAVLVLRAMGEWRTIKEHEDTATAPPP